MQSLSNPMQHLTFDKLQLSIAEGWRHIPPEELGIPDVQAPVLLGKENTVYRDGLPLMLAFSVQLYRGGPRPSYSEEGLQDALQEYMQETYGQEPLEVTVSRVDGRTFAAGNAIAPENQEMVRVWYISDGINLAFVSFGYAIVANFSPTVLTECEEIVQSIQFNVLPEVPLEAGGIYSIAQAFEGVYGLWKVLVYDEQAIHVCELGASFESRPSEAEARQFIEELKLQQNANVDLDIHPEPEDEMLQLDSVLQSLEDDFDNGTLFIGHLPVNPEMFWNSDPSLIFIDAVLPDELEGYNIWKESGGGVW